MDAGQGVATLPNTPNIWITTSFVDYSELDRYLQNGWREGKGPRNYVNRINYRNK